MCHNKGDEFHGRGWAPGLFLTKADTNNSPLFRIQRNTPWVGQPLICNHLEKTITASGHQSHRTYQQATASENSLCFPQTSNLVTQKKGWQAHSNCTLKKRHFPHAGVAVTLLGHQMNIKTKVNIVIFCFVSGTGGVVPSTQSVNSNNPDVTKEQGSPHLSTPIPTPPNAIPPEITHLEETHSRFPTVHMLLPNGSG